MKNVRQVALLLTIVLILSMLCSCEYIDKALDMLKPPADDTPTDNFIPGDPIDGFWIPEIFSYSIIADSATYECGEEINICVTVQFYNDYSGEWNFFSYPEVDLTVKMKESESFEFLGDSSVCFKNVRVEDYLDGAKDCGALVADFKIRINEPTYVIDELNVSAELVFVDEDGEYIHTPGRNLDFYPMYYITDDQGVIMYSVECCNNDWNPKYEKPSDDLLYYLDKNALYERSYAREYSNGVQMEELIDRYIHARIPNIAYVYMEYKNRSDYDVYIMDYVSETLRLRIILPAEDKVVSELRPDYLNEQQPRIFVEHLLDYALSIGVISEEEYTTEIGRYESGNLTPIKNSVNYLILKCEEISFPGEDYGYFNHYIDLSDL